MIRRFLRASAILVVWLAVLGAPGIVRAQTPPQDPSPVPSPSLAPGDRTVVGAPTVSIQTFQRVLTDAQSPMAFDAQAIYRRIEAAGIDPNFALAIMRKESNFATDPQWAGRKADGTFTHNWGNLRCAGYTRCYNGWRDYASWTEATDDWLRNLQQNYLALGLTTVATIITKYAPPLDGNDTPGYIEQVLTWMRDAQANVLTPVPADDGVLSIDAWVVAPLNGANVDVWQQVALSVWAWNQTTLAATDALVSFRATFTPALGPVLDRIGASATTVALAMLALGVVLAGGAQLLAPAFAVRQTLISLRALPLVAFLTLAVLPTAGAAFIATEHMRQATNDAIYRGLFDATTEIVSGATQPTTPGGIGEIPPFFPDRDTRHAVDVAAAYVLATRDDLARDDALPQRFTETFFPETSAVIREQNPELRQQAIGRATRGANRMANGIVLTGLGFLEEAIGAAFLFGLLVFTVAFMITLLIAVFSPVLRLVDTLWGHVLQLLLWSILISVLQGMGMAALFRAAAVGSGAQVSGIGALLCVVNAVLLVATVLIVGRALKGGVQAIGRFQPIADSMSLTDRAYHGIQSRLAARSTQSVRAPTPGPMGVRQVVSAYAGARAIGASRNQALAYVAGPSAMAQRVGAAALVMGRLGRDEERALLIGGSSRVGQPGSLRSLAALRDAVAPPVPAPQLRQRPRYVGPTPSPVRPRRPSSAQYAGTVQANARARRVQKGVPTP